MPKQPTKPEQPSKPEQPDVPSFNAATVWTVGDSTVCSFNDTYYYPRYGWGTQLEHYFDSSLTVKNLALSGRSSKSYVQEEQYQTLMQGMKAGGLRLLALDIMMKKRMKDGIRIQMAII